MRLSGSAISGRRRREWKDRQNPTPSTAGALRIVTDARRSRSELHDVSSSSDCFGRKAPLTAIVPNLSR